jgi:uncharacterized protein
MNTVEMILSRYRELSNYCEKFWLHVSQKYASDIACHASCGICCELQTVNVLEAYFIYRFLSTASKNTAAADSGKCAFLNTSGCRIYSIRPLICRTHGLVMKSREFVDKYSITCPYNFYSDESVIQEDAILDIDKITENMVKLNYTYCMVHNRKHLASERVLLTSIADGTLPLEIRELFEMCNE